MVDVMSVEKRSALMSRIGGKNTAPELKVRKLLWHAGLRYSLHAKNLPGRPDIVLSRWRVALFVHGCFWHRHDGCLLFRLPSTREAFWSEKLDRNRARDAAAVNTLTAADWRVGIVWECALKADAENTGLQLVSWIRNGSTRIELIGIDHAVANVAHD